LRRATDCELCRRVSRWCCIGRSDLRLFPQVSAFLAAAAIAAPAAADWPYEHKVSAYGAGLLLGAVAQCMNWSEDQLVAQESAFNEWLFEDVGDADAQGELSAARDQGAQAGMTMAEQEPERCSRWIDDLERAKASLQLRYSVPSQKPPPQ